MMKEITVFNRDEFRRWLMKNHEKEKGVGVIVYKKHTGKKFPSHNELIREAICFGWIDTTLKRLDDEKYIRTFTRRNKNSKWSENTLRYGKELIVLGRMTPVGLKFYKEGLARPTHDAHVPKNPSMPDELKKALLGDKKAASGFEKFAPSFKKILYRWVLSGKRSETREKRVKIIVEKAKVGDRNVFG
jgi:uncharacterized protein YdeI (YjbR/CyaY-like superfamily)